MVGIHLAIAVKLHHFPALYNPYDDNNYGNHKQNVNEASGMKSKEAYQPSNDQDDGNNVK